MLSHKETYEKVCESKTELLNLMFELINTPLWDKAKSVVDKLKDVSNSEHEKIINEIQNQPIAEWKP